MNHILDPHATLRFRTKLQDGGRLVIPAECRKALDLVVGEEMIIRVKDGEIHVYSARQAVSRAQRLVEKYDKRKGKSVVDEFIAERRREAKRELE